MQLSLTLQSHCFLTFDILSLKITKHILGSANILYLQTQTPLFYDVFMVIVEHIILSFHFPTVP